MEGEPGTYTYTLYMYGIYTEACVVTTQVETELADDAFLLALQAAEQKVGQITGGRGGAEGGGVGGGPLHREARPRSAAAVEGGGWGVDGGGGGGRSGDGGGGGLDAPSALPDHPRRRRRFAEIHEIDETHGAPPVGLPVDMRCRICPKPPSPPLCPSCLSPAPCPRSPPSTLPPPS